MALNSNLNLCWKNDYSPSTVLLLKIVLDNWLSMQIFTSTPKFLQRGDHIWPKFEKQVKPLGFLKKSLRMIEMIRSTEWVIGERMWKFFCYKRVKILVLKKEQGKNLYRYNKWETEQNVCKKWPEQCSIKHVNCEATIEFLWLWIGLTLRFSRVDKNNGKIIHYIWEDACYIFICLFL